MQFFLGLYGLRGWKDYDHSNKDFSFFLKTVFIAKTDPYYILVQNISEEYTTCNCSQYINI